MKITNDGTVLTSSIQSLYRQCHDRLRQAPRSWHGRVRGALAGGVVGLVTAIVLMVLGPAVWVGVLGYERAVFPEPFPALYSVVAAFGTMFGVSMLDRSEQGATDRGRFAVMRTRH